MPAAEPEAPASAANEALAWMMTAPAEPVTDSSDQVYADPAVAVDPDEQPSYDALIEYAPPPKRRKMAYAVLGLFIFAALGIGGTYFIYLKRKAAKEVKLPTRPTAP